MGQETDREQDAPEEVERDSGAACDESLEERVQRLEQECDELKTSWSRARADYQNLKRRAQADYEAGIQRTMQPLLEDLLFVLDFLDMALASPATNDETRNLAKGVEMTRTKFAQALEREDVRPIDTTGDFDPSVHEATATVDRPDLEPGTIVETVRHGYTWRGNVLRHAHVVVAAGDADAASDEPDPR